MLELANKMPYMHFIAWDILIMEDGEICIIEANTSSGVNIIQLWGGRETVWLWGFFSHAVFQKQRWKEGKGGEGGGREGHNRQGTRWNNYNDIPKAFY